LPSSGDQMQREPFGEGFKAAMLSRNPYSVS